ncbi:MAG: hypothetical protein LBJ32_00790 [Oscillospiraceae bacterium]|jgi:hypothetical protein|nr:hypothetical protein [Oscillospiraceae bacterium]
MQQECIFKSETTTEIELAKINKFTKRELKLEEIYVFSVVLCDNEIDRDYDRFTKESLNKLAELFVGKTGIFDHDAKSEKQAARIYECTIENITEKLNSMGEVYSRLVAKAYIPKSKNNEDFILAIDSGIKKEVSIRCLIERSICSICGENISICEHKKGQEYQNKICHAVLKNPTDAYEWSFVAIPAQREAGVIKHFNQNESKKIFEEKNHKRNTEIIENLKEEAQIGREYICELKNEIKQLFKLTEPEINQNILEKLTQNFSVEDLKNLQNILQKKIFDTSELSSQLAEENPLASKKITGFSQFKI